MSPLRASAIGVVALAAAVASANTGIVTDEDGDTLEGVSVCLVVQAEDILCSETDAAGYYELPTTAAEWISVRLAGYLPRLIEAVPQDAPVVLRRAASILILLRDAGDDSPVAAGQIWILRPNGSRLGPLPTAEAGSVRFKTLEPGTVTLSVKAPGYRAATSGTLTLVGGRESEAVVKLEPEGS